MNTLSSVVFVAALAASAPLSAATLDFSAATCNGGDVCSNASVLDQSYGDTTGLNVVYDRNIGLAGLQDVYYWGTGYETFGSVIWTDQTATLSVLFDVLAGYTLSILSINFAPFADRTVATEITVTDVTDGSVEASGGFNPLSTAGITSLAGLFQSTDGLLISFGPDAFNAGIGSIEYILTPTTATVPLPAALPLLLVALGGLGFAGRRRKAL